MNVKKKQIKLNSIQIDIAPLLATETNSLKSKWLELEKTSSPSFFLSWKWIGTWLKQVIPTQKLIVVSASHHNEVVGLGIFVEKTTTRYGLLKSTQWFLHRSGNDVDDQIWIENNNFLMSKKNEQLVLTAIWQALCKLPQSVDEFVIAMYHKKTEQCLLPKSSNYNLISSYTETGYYLSLKNMFTLEDYLITLSKNTRKQLKRSYSLLQQENFTFEIIEDPAQQLVILNQSKQWHIDKWENTETPSGFTNTKFINFHENLLNEKHLHAKTVMASLTINNELYGCLYCFIDDNCAYFYLSAFKELKDNRIKLGLTLHMLFIQWLIEQKPLITNYDLLAGHARYKQSLAHHQDEYAYLIVQKNSLKFKIENKLKLVKQSFKQ